FRPWRYYRLSLNLCMLLWFSFFNSLHRCFRLVLYYLLSFNNRLWHLWFSNRFRRRCNRRCNWFWNFFFIKCDLFFVAFFPTFLLYPFLNFYKISLVFCHL